MTWRWNQDQDGEGDRMEVVITQTRALQGEVRVPADKSISHRAVMLAALAVGQSRVRNFLRAADTLATIRCMRSLGVNIVEQDNELIIEGRGGRAAPTGRL